MADINHIITLGIGTPGDIKHFILFGLNIGGANPGGSTATDALRGDAVLSDALRGSASISNTLIGTATLSDTDNR